jgi:glycosyltransferase involved in cell wall biosynthesis
VRIVFVSWARYDRRSELLAHRLGATMHFVYRGRRGKVLQAPVRYLAQAVQTWRVLRQDRPDVVLVQNPPIVCAFVAFLYHRRHGAQYVIDSHTDAFLGPIWRRFLWLHRMLSWPALTTIVHNESQEKTVRTWGCRYLVLADPVGGYPAGQHFPADAQFSVVVISTGAGDEPLDIVFEAAKQLPEVTFYVTGDPICVAPGLLTQKPDNCRLTGFLPYDRYVGLLRAVDVIMDLTTRDHTLLCGAFEAVSLGKPLIVSDWPILRQYFPIGTVHVPNTVQGICDGVRRARGERAALQRDILRLREQMHAEWDQRFDNLQQLLRASQPVANRPFQP